MSTPIVNRLQTPRIEALRWESRLRAIHAILIAGTLSVLYFGTSFPKIANLIVPLGAPVGHIAAAAIAFAVVAIVVRITLLLLFRLKIRQAGLRRIRSRAVRETVESLARQFGIRVLALKSGGPRDGRMSAFTIGRHLVVRIGIGVLPLVVRKPEDFRFRLAHEIAHLWAGDPGRDQVVLSAYLAAAILFGAVLGSILINVASSISVVANAGGFEAAVQVWWSTLWFTIVANLVAIGFLGLNLFLEHRSAMRLREFHADAVASDLVGPRPEVFSNSSGALPSGMGGMFARFAATHPGIGVRRQAMTKLSRVFTADRILFVFQGYFGAVVFEVLLQLLFVNASQSLASIEVRRAHLSRVMADDPEAYLGVIGIAAILLVVSYGIAVGRVRSSIEYLQNAHTRGRFGFLAMTLTLFVVGTLMALGSSQSVLWDLKQTGWDTIGYVRLNYDRLAVHVLAIAGFLAAISVGLLASKKTRNALLISLLLGGLPVFGAGLAGVLLYWV